MSTQEIAKRVLEAPQRIVVEEPTSQPQGLDPLTFILLLPFLPFYLFLQFFNQGARRRLTVTEIERTQTGGWRIFEYER